MIITDLAEIKDFLGIDFTDTSKDDFINLIIPVAIDFIFKYTGNNFAIKNTGIISNSLSFSNIDSTITDANAQLLNNTFFSSNQIIRVENSIYNNGVYEIDSVTASIIMIKTGYTFNDEDSLREIKISIISYPLQLKEFVAKFCQFYFPQKQGNESLDSERFDDYTVKYKDKSKGLSEDILNLIEDFKILEWG